MQLNLYGEKIWILKRPVDFRQSIDGLCNLIADTFEVNPTTGLFIFYNKSRNKLKCLSWHKNGFMLVYKRLEHGKFKLHFDGENSSEAISVNELNWLLAGLEWQQMKRWGELDYKKFG